MSTYGKGYSVSAFASGGAVVGSTSFAQCTYVYSSGGLVVTVFWGPGQTILSSIVLTGATFTLYSGAIFTNS